MTAPDLSVIIPVFNRGDLIRHTLESVRASSAGLRVETIVVDDGSAEPAREVLARLGFAQDVQVIRQENRGLLFARLRGLQAATGEHVLFLDSDDFVSAEKFRAQLSAMRSTSADISYTDSARVNLAAGETARDARADEPCAATNDIATFCICVQPAPHGPIWRRSFLQRVIDGALIRPSPLYNHVAEIWFYHNAAVLPGRVIKVPGPYTIIGQHGGSRLTDHWEQLAVASLAVMEAFARHCPRTDTTRHARQLVAEKAFKSWRRLPIGFNREFGRRELGVWRGLRTATRLPALGGPTFQSLARFLGPVPAARILRLRNSRYASCRTMSDSAVAMLLARLPVP